MACIALIHGSTQTAACWDLVVPYLLAAGHKTIAVQLPADHPDFSATDFARLAADQMPDGCVVVAHSASGSFLPLIADLRPVHALVYLAAMIPAPGVSVLDQLQSNPEMLRSDWIRAGSQWLDPANWRELADRFLFHDVVPSRLPWAYSTIRPMRLDGAAREPLASSSIAAVRSLCVVCLGDRTISPAWQERVWRERAMDWPLVRLNAGHCPHVSVSEETARTIDAWCKKTGAAEGEFAAPIRRRNRRPNGGRQAQS